MALLIHINVPKALNSGLSSRLFRPALFQAKTRLESVAAFQVYYFAIQFWNVAIWPGG
jgi:hypothetical protein